MSSAIIANVNSQQVCHADEDVCLFMFTFVLKHSLFVYAFFFLSSKRRLTVHLTYQGCSTAFAQVVDE